MGEDDRGIKEGRVLAGAAQTARSPPRTTLLSALSRSDVLPPDMSAQHAPSIAQLAGLAILAAGLAAAFYGAPQLALTATKFVFWATFFLVVAWRLCLVLHGAWLRIGPKPTPKPALGSVGLPVYTVLVALRHEAGMMVQLAASLSAIDWPADRLEVILLVEADDDATRKAAEAAVFPDGTRVLTVPQGRPLTKPRALNYGLAHATGDYVTVYDAEDTPHPDQLREAYARFIEAPRNVLCLQAPLVATNGSASWIAAHWSLEYAVHFGLAIPALSKLRHPIMLGGTSNHFRRADLVAFGGWDAWNVTEDADIGLRAARLGGLTEVITSPTLESAPETFGVWRAQRSRWIKGYMQTWFVCMKSPVSLLAELGLMRWVSLQLTLGGTVLSAFLYGPMTLLIMAGLIVPAVTVDLVSFALFGFGWVSGAVAEFLAPGRWSFSRCLALATRPLYWPLQLIAAISSLYGLAVRPSFWAKTPHRPDRTEYKTGWQPGSSPFQS